MKTELHELHEQRDALLVACKGARPYVEYLATYGGESSKQAGRICDVMDAAIAKAHAAIAEPVALAAEKGERA